ncbi:glycosyltransferase [Lactiplantibacillus pentosus]|uniref:glycosyltransferase n=1 Tax=Lactiplantibacillus pentosus TaxID=1589 RepID=UPI003C188F2E
MVSHHLNNDDYAIIHLNFLSSLILTKFKKIIGDHVKYVFHQHMAVNFGLKQVIKGTVLRLCAPKKVAYIGVSPEVYRDVKREVGKRKSYLVLNAIDVKRLKLLSNTDSSDVLIFGTAFMRKGVDLAIKAIQNTILAKKCKLLVVTHDEKKARQLIQEQYVGLPKFVKLLPPVQNVEELYQKTFLFLSPSRLEAFGYASVEASYSGDQVIISDIPGQNILSAIPGVRTVPSENVQ